MQIKENVRLAVEDQDFHVSGLFIIKVWQTIHVDGAPNMFEKL
jgi:hypothetical protein